MVVWVSETHARWGPMYSAHLLCSKPGEEAQKTQSDVMFYPKDDKQMSIGPRFSELKDYQRCSAGEPSPKDGRFDGPRADGLRMPIDHDFTHGFAIPSKIDIATARD
jgi:hypothetical protein